MALTTWTREELTRIAGAEEVAVTFEGAECSQGRSVTIWVVREHDDLYARSVRGRDAWWFRRVLDGEARTLSAGGVETAAAFIEVDDKLDRVLDAAYHSKYGRFAASVERITSARAASATVKLVPA